LRFILNAVIAGQATHYFVTLQVVEDSGHVLTRNAGHGGEIIPPNLLTDDDPPRLFAGNFPPARAASGQLGL
jgi:hypothetical protein